MTSSRSDVGEPDPGGPRTPWAGAAGIILDEAGRVLIVKENYDRRRWGLPGGALEPGETPEEAAVRETWEETGLTVQIEHTVGSYTFDDGFTAHAFFCVVLGGIPSVPPTGEIAEIRWVPLDDVPMPRSNILHYAVEDVARGLRNQIRIDVPRVS